MSTIRMRWPKRARAVPRLAVVAVLPTPPFWFATAMIPAIMLANYREVPAVTALGSRTFIPNTVRKFLTIAALIGALAVPVTAHAADTTFFPQTNHSVTFGFKHFF